MLNNPSTGSSLASRVALTFILWGVGTFLLTNAVLWWGANYFIESYLEREAAKLLSDYDELGTPLYFSDSSSAALGRMRLHASRDPDILFVRYYSAPDMALLGHYAKDGSARNQIPFPQVGEFSQLEHAAPAILTSHTLGLVESMRALAPVRTHSIASDSLFDIDLSKPNPESSKTIGYLEIGMDVDSLRQYMVSGLLLLSAVLGGVVLLAYFMGRRNIHHGLSPLLDLQEPLRQLADGDFNVQVKMEGADSEIAAIGQAMTRTIAALQQRDAEKEEALRGKLHAELANQAKSQFVAHMSHEIRTPLSGLIGFVNLLGKTELGEVQRAYLRNCEISAKSLMSVINDILDFSKIEAGKLSVEHIDLDLREIVDDCVAVHAANAEAKGLNLVVKYNRDVPFRFIGDPMRITQILSNLVGNAIKFTDTGEIVVTVSLVKEANDRVVIQFEVVDTGIGISSQDMDKLFQPFTQVNDASNRQHGGTGLGLIISQKLVELMGGKIEAQSHLGAGSRFAFTLDLQKQPARAAAAAHAQPRVMVLSPNYHLAHAIYENLMAWGMHDEIVNDPHEALALMAEAYTLGNPFHAVIVDSALTGMSVVDFAMAVRGDRRIADAGLLLLTGSDERMKREPGDYQGYNYCLSKPAKSSELFEALSKFGVRVPDPSAPEHATSMQGLHILVVDDHEINRELITILLESKGVRVEQAENGVAAVAACARQHYDLVLMDINMPDMDGLMATSKIRELEADKSRTPIVALTANAMIDDRQRYLAAGMDDCLVKPPSEKALLAIIAAYCPRGNPAQ